MPIFGGSQFERLLSKATDEQITEPDWMGMMAMCDLVRQQETTPANALSIIRKKLFDRNSQVVVNTLLVLECLVKNCGQPMHEQVTQFEFLEELKELVRTGYATVRTKVLALVASWNEVFKGEYRYNSVKETYDALKGEGFLFPQLNTSEDLFDAARAPEWEDGRMCHLCRQLFSLTKRKHHCRNCGQIFCAECTSDRIPLPAFGIEKEVRVCSICCSKLGGKSEASTSVAPAAATTAASGTKQPPSNPQAESEEKKKQEELELKEKEEFDLAIALSLSQQESAPTTTVRPQSPAESAPAESAPAENLYAEVEHVRPAKEQPASTSFYPDLSNAQVVTNGIYPAVTAAPLPQQHPTKFVTNPPPIEHQPQDGVEVSDDLSYTQQVKDLTEMLMRKLNQAAMKGQHVGTDPHIQTLLASLTALHPKLVTDIEETERQMNTQQKLLTKLGTCEQARASLDKMRGEHLEKVRQQEEEQSVLMRLQMEQKLELLRQQKMEQLKYQEELKRKHEQAVTDRESAKMHNGAPSTIYSAPLNTVQSPAQINVQVPAAQVPAAQVPAGQSSEQENPVPQPDVVMSTHVNPTSYVPHRPVLPQQPVISQSGYQNYVPPHHQAAPPGAAPQHQHPQHQPPQHQHPQQQPPQQQPPQQQPPQQQPPQQQPPQHQPPGPQHQPPQSYSQHGMFPHYQLPPGAQLPPQFSQMGPPRMGPQFGGPPPGSAPAGHHPQYIAPHQQLYKPPPPNEALPPQQTGQPQPPIPKEAAVNRPYGAPAQLNNNDVMSALNNAPAPPTEVLHHAAPRERRPDPPIADLISF